MNGRRYRSVPSLAILLSVFMFACTSDALRLQQEVAGFAKDKQIDANEYGKLLDLVRQSKDGSLRSLVESDGTVSDAKFRNHLVKVLTALKLGLSASDIWQPQREQSSSFVVDVFIENSASMDGYVKGMTEFETAIYNLLGDLKVSGLAKALNLNYINRTITYSRPNALQPDIQDFIEKLEPSTFAQRGGDRGTSDLQNILKTMLEKVDGNNLVVLASDFVFSPGKKKDAQDYLNNQTVGIKIEFAEKLKTLDLAVAVVQLQSSFEGTYYDKFNSPHALNCQRPYYIWFFGTSGQIRELLNKRVLDTIKGGSLNRLIFSPARDATPMESKILLRPRIGSFELEDGARGAITGARAESGVFEFSVAVSFPDSMEDSSYFLDPKNYKISDPRYTISVLPISSSDQSLTGFTHKLVFRTGELQEGSLDVSVVGRVPSWIEDTTSLDDTGIACGNDEAKKTFGFKYLIDGVNDAFFPQASPNNLYTTRIVIKR